MRAFASPHITSALSLTLRSLGPRYRSAPHAGIIRKMNDIAFSVKTADNRDIEFIFELRLKTMKTFFLPTIGWDNNEQYKSAVAYLDCAQIILMNENRVGVVKILEESNQLVLHQIQLLPDFQKQGTGTKIVQQLIKRSDYLSLPIKLMVNLSGQQS